MFLDRMPEMVDTFRVMIRHHPNDPTFKRLTKDVASYLTNEATTMDIGAVLLTSCEMFCEAGKGENFTDFCQQALLAEPGLRTKVKENRQALETISSIADGK